MRVFKILLVLCLAIIFIYVSLYSLTFIAYKYGNKCQCYGIKTNNVCIGIRTTCTGLAPTFAKIGNGAIMDTCDPVKNAENITVDLIAEQWARLLLAQIRANNNTTLIKGKDTFRSPFSHK